MYTFGRIVRRNLKENFQGTVLLENIGGRMMIPPVLYFLKFSSLFKILEIFA